MKWPSMYRPFRGADPALWRWMGLLSKQNLLLTSTPPDELLTTLESHLADNSSALLGLSDVRKHVLPDELQW